MSFRPLLLAHSFNPTKTDPLGYWVSSKLDGIRCYWDGDATLWSRQGNPFTKAPASLISKLPKGMSLDGELYLGPGRFNDTVRAVKGHAGWSEIRYVVFDAPAESAPFELRMCAAMTAWNDCALQTKCRGLDHLHEALAAVEAGGGEGLMLRQPGSLYEGKRSHTLLKVKSFHDQEVTVVGHTMGKGRNVGRLGAIQCRLDNGVVVDAGTGFTDAERAAPPAIGSRVTIRYQELTPAGVPRFPVFVAVRDYE